MWHLIVCHQKKASVEKYPWSKESPGVPPLTPVGLALVPAPLPPSICSHPSPVTPSLEVEGVSMTWGSTWLPAWSAPLCQVSLEKSLNHTVPLCPLDVTREGKHKLLRGVDETLRSQKDLSK